MGRYGITAALAALVVVAAGCSDGDTSAPRPTGAPPTTVTVAPTTEAPTTVAPTTARPTPRTTTPPAPTGVPYDPDVRCTDRVNYAGDPRSNAEINSIGERTGTCPASQR